MIHFDNEPETPCISKAVSKTWSIFQQMRSKEFSYPSFSKLSSEQNYDSKVDRKISSERKLNGGGPQGAIFEIWDYLAQSN